MTSKMNSKMIPFLTLLLAWVPFGPQGGKKIQNMTLSRAQGSKLHPKFQKKRDAKHHLLYFKTKPTTNKNSTIVKLGATNL